MIRREDFLCGWKPGDRIRLIRRHAKSRGLASRCFCLAKTDQVEFHDRLHRDAVPAYRVTGLQNLL